jgi:hypothetical protein
MLRFNSTITPALTLSLTALLFAWPHYAHQALLSNGLSLASTSHAEHSVAPTMLLLMCKATTATFQKIGGVFGPLLSTSALQTTLKALMSALVGIMGSSGDNVNKEVLVLAGMAIAYLLKLLKTCCSLQEQASAANAVFFPPTTAAVAADATPSTNTTSTSTNTQTIPPSILEKVLWLVPLPLPSTLLDLARLSAIRSALSVLDKDVLLTTQWEGAATSHTTLLFDVCFPQLQAISAHSRSPAVLFFAHSIIALWITAAKEASQKEPFLFYTACDFLSVYDTMIHSDGVRTPVTSGTALVAAPSTAASAASTVGARMFDQLTNLIWESWEHPVSDVRSLTKSMFADLLTLLESQSKWASTFKLTAGPALVVVPPTGFCELLAMRLAKCQWHVKGRYGLLCNVAMRLGAEKLLALAPSLPGDCVQCLQVNTLAPQGIRLISELCKAARKEWELELLAGASVSPGTAGKSAGKEKDQAVKGGKKQKDVERKDTKEPKLSPGQEIVLATKWSNVWRDAMLTALSSDDQHTRQQVATYWLPETMTLFPAALGDIVSKFNLLLGFTKTGERIVEFSDPSAANVRTRRLHALMVTIKSARAVGLISGDCLVGGPEIEGYDDEDMFGSDDDEEEEGEEEAEQGGAGDGEGEGSHGADIRVPYALVQEALRHAELQIQLDGLAFVCCDHKPSVEVTTPELALLKDFVPRNLNMHEAGARQQFYSLIKVALIRLRGAWIQHNTASDAVARKLQRHDTEHGEAECHQCIVWICEMDEHEIGITRTGDAMVETVQWLNALTMASLYPGSSYVLLSLQTTTFINRLSPRCFSFLMNVMKEVLLSLQTTSQRVCAGEGVWCVSCISAG